MLFRLNFFVQGPELVSIAVSKTGKANRRVNLELACTWNSINVFKEIKFNYFNLLEEVW